MQMQLDLLQPLRKELCSSAGATDGPPSFRAASAYCVATGWRGVNKVPKASKVKSRFLVGVWAMLDTCRGSAAHVRLLHTNAVTLTLLVQPV